MTPQAACVHLAAERGPRHQFHFTVSRSEFQQWLRERLIAKTIMAAAVADPAEPVAPPVLDLPSLRVVADDDPASLLPLPDGLDQCEYIHSLVRFHAGDEEAKSPEPLLVRLPTTKAVLQALADQATLEAAVMPPELTAACLQLADFLRWEAVLPMLTLQVAAAREPELICLAELQRSQWVAREQPILLRQSIPPPHEMDTMLMMMTKLNLLRLRRA